MSIQDYPVPSRELAATRLMQHPVRATISFPSGETSTRIVDWVDRRSVHRFGILSRQALLSGGSTHTEAL